MEKIGCSKEDTCGLVHPADSLATVLGSYHVIKVHQVLKDQTIISNIWVFPSTKYIYLETILTFHFKRGSKLAIWLSMLKTYSNHGWCLESSMQESICGVLHNPVCRRTVWQCAPQVWSFMVLLSKAGEPCSGSAAEPA